VIRRVKNIYHLFCAFLANLIFRYPASRLKAIGVTGTDGKTTVTHLIYEILKSAEKKVSIISSVKAEIEGKEYETGFHVTTPSSWLLQRFLRKAVDRGVEYVVLETTSHALDQHRVFGIAYEIGVLTNVTDEHLDYHQNYNQYLRTKLKLLERVRTAIVNREDKSYQAIRISGYQGIGGEKLITYGIEKGDVTSHNFKFTTPLAGEYNQYNCLAAIAAAKSLGIKDEIIKKAISGFKGIIGRFEFIPTSKDFKVVIDFAHTPNALKQILKTLRPMVKGKLIHVFGCAGLRDRKKRPMMGEISAKHADIIILTEEDYRTEDVNKIIQEIEKGVDKNPKFQISNSKSRCKNRGPMTLDESRVSRLRRRCSTEMSAQIQNSKFQIPNRQKAINQAIKLARRDDLVLLTGKGHEKSLCRGKKEHSWSEHKAVKYALRVLRKG